MVLAVVNKHFKMWLWVLIGLNIITMVHGWGHGNFADTYSCTSMLPTHRRHGVALDPQNSDPPFEIIVNPGIEGDPITVILRSKHATEFRGFMLQARKRGSEFPVGKFLTLESDKTQLLRCNDSLDTAVSQSNNQRKTSFKVNWTSLETERDIFFRATFVQYFDTFWEPVDVKVPPRSTTPPPTTTPSSTTSTELSTTTTTEPSITTSPEPRTTTSTEPGTTTSTEPGTTTVTESSTTVPSTADANSTTEQGRVIFNQLEGAGNVAMNGVSFLVGVKMVLPGIFITTLTNNPFSRSLKKVSKITCSLLCAAVEFSALVLFCVAEPIKVTLIALVCVAIVINFIELVILCLPIGPSHELKEICDFAVKVCSVIHQIFTIAVIFVGVMEIENCRKGTGPRNRNDSWVLKVMVAYTVWILLCVVWDFVISTQRTAILGRSKIGSPRWSRQQKKEKLSAAEVIVTAVSVILFFGNLCFTVAVAVGNFGCPEK